MATPHAAEIEAQEKKLEELKRTFDLYFMGLEKKPPFEEREAFLKTLGRLRTDAIKWKLVERYRVNTLYQKYTTYGRLWDRTLKQIEDGTWKRDKLKVHLRKKREEEQQQQQQPAPEQMLDRTDPHGENLVVNSQAPAPAGIDLPPVPAKPVPPRPAAAARPASASGGESMNDAKLKQLYDVYMQAKKRTGEKSQLTYDQLAAQIKKQIPQIKQKHGCADVEFKVVLKDGKAMLKAIPK